MSSRRPAPLRFWKTLLVVAGCWAALAGATNSAKHQAFTDPVDQPAQPSALAAHSPIMAMAKAGTRLVAAGVRGHILWSDDGGQNWQQARVPVSVDLVGLSFPTPDQGWAVGHGGVVLHTADGAKTWERQLSGLDSVRSAILAYEVHPPQDGQLLPALRGQLQDPRGEPFLDVYFWNERSGIIVGTFGSIYRTDDGGQRWVPWMDRIDNPGALNFFSVRGHGGRIFVAGEQGKVWRLDAENQRFVSISTPYNGTLFGLHVRSGGVVIAFGMRGALLRSADDGVTWTPVEAHTGAGITAATQAGDGRVVLADQAGNLLTSDDAGVSFRRTPAQPPAPIFALVGTSGKAVVIGGPIGLLPQPLPQPQP